MHKKPPENLYGISGFLFFLSILLLGSSGFAETINYLYDEGDRLTRVSYEDNTTVDIIYDALGNRLTRSTTLVGTPSNTSPNQVVNPAIPPDATDVSTTPSLSWDNTGDPDSGDQVSYSMYFGTSGDLQFINTGFDFSYQPEQLASLTTYCWQVIARDNHNEINEGPTWCFTTGNEPPEASFEITMVSVPALREIRFSDTSVSVDDEIVSWEWDFNNDGIVDSYAQHPTFTYAQNGDYTVTLTVTDTQGSQGVATMYLPLAEFTQLDEGEIAEDMTLTAEKSPYVVTTDLTIVQGTTLTIEAGVVVKFVPGSFLTVDGTLIAQGSAEASIYLTSNKDDSVGGDTNGDGSTTSPARGDWRSVNFQFNSTNNTMDHVVVRYAGDYGGNISLGNSSLTMSYCTIEESAAEGILVYNSQVTISDSTIRGNGSNGIEIVESSGTVTGNVISNNSEAAISLSDSDVAITDNTMTGNAINAVEVSGNLIRDATWSGSSTVYFVNGSFGVDSSSTLTIEPGAIVKLGEGASLYIYGTIIAEGTSDAPIHFTSEKDDSVGGDTNADGSTTSPARGDWDSIYFQTAGTGSLFDHVIVRYGGGSGANLYMDSSSLTMSHCIIEESAGTGLYTMLGQATLSGCTIQNNNSDGCYLEDSDATFTNNSIIDNGGHGLNVNESSVTITESNLTGNIGYGINNNSFSTVVSAENNYWGDPSGPLDPSDDTGSGGLYNPGGTGAQVSDLVDYSSWSQNAFVIDPGDVTAVAAVTPIGLSVTIAMLVMIGLAAGSRRRMNTENSR